MLVLKALTVSIALVTSLLLSFQPRAGAAVSRCAMAHLAARLGPDVSATTGAHPIALRVVNRSRSECWLKGYPAVVLRDGRGAIPFVYVHRGDIMVTSRPSRAVVLRPGASAYVLLDKFRCDLGSRRDSTSVQIGLEGSPVRSHPVALRGGGLFISLCKPGLRAEGRVVFVSPFEPTLRATLHG